MFEVLLFEIVSFQGSIVYFQKVGLFKLVLISTGIFQLLASYQIKSLLLSNENWIKSQ